MLVAVCGTIVRQHMCVAVCAGEEACFSMHLGAYGQAYFAAETMEIVSGRFCHCSAPYTFCIHAKQAAAEPKTLRP